MTEEIKQENKENPEKDKNNTGYKVGYKKPPLESRFTSENQPSPEKKSRKGIRDWTTDMNEAIKSAAKILNKPISEVRTDVLVRIILEARKGNYSFTNLFIEREYGKLAQLLEADIAIVGTKELADTLQKILNDNETKESNTNNSPDIFQKE
jgi:hypothetical protein